MLNYKPSEKSRGVLAFANNTNEIDYVSIGGQALRLASHHLGIPTKLVTTGEVNNWRNTRNDIDTGQSILWKNHGRHMAYDLSPWDETIVIDVDYLITTSKLLTLFDSSMDLLLCHENNYFYDNSKGNAGHIMPVWATVFFFRKSNQARTYFDLVGRIQRNWSYYRLLFGITQPTFRNDFAFAMAESILFGNESKLTKMPFSITTAEQPVTKISINADWMVVRDDQQAHILPRQDLHVMSKQWLQSTEFDKFVQEALV